MSKLVEMRLGDFVALQRGHDLPADQRKDGTIPVMGSFGVTGFHDKARCGGPGVTIGRSGASIGVVSYIDRPYWPLNTCLYVTDFKGNDPLFAYHFLKTLDLSVHNSGSAQPSLNRNFIYPIPIAVPVPHDQRVIAALLGGLDDKIELNRRMSATLEEMARALFRSWFVDFDPVHAKARGEAPAHMDAATAALFPNRFGPDGLPEGWFNEPLSALCHQRKATVDPGRHEDELFEHFSLPAYDAGAYPVREAGREIKSQKLIVPSGSILFSRLNPSIPRVWWPRPSSDVFLSVASTEFLVAEPRDAAELPYLYAVLASEDFRTDVLARVTGTSNSHQRVKPGSILEIEVPMGSDAVRRAYSDMARGWFDRAAQAVAENQTLASLRDTLLPKLMSGELRVRDAERQVAEAV